MSNLLKMMAGSATPPLYVDDVFQSYTRTGTDAEVTVTTNIDMTEGYTLWSKRRSGATDHALYASSLGVTIDLVTNTTAGTTTQAQGLTAVSSTGHTYGTLAKVNTSTATYVDWVFRDAAKFHKQTTVVKSAGSNATVDLSSLGTVGMVRVKRTDAAGSWYIWHKDLTAGNLLIGETTAAQAVLGQITVSGTTLTLVNGVIADGTYLVEGFAHDTSATGVIQCGSFTTDGSGNATVNLGWEPQFLEHKAMLAASSWRIYDSTRGGLISNPTGLVGLPTLTANTSAAESTTDSFYIDTTAVGFKAVGGGLGASYTYIYLAIRRPNKPPTSGTQVYAAYSGSGGAAFTTTGFPVDLAITAYKPGGYSFWMMDRLRGGANTLSTQSTAVEASYDAACKFDYMNGVALGTGWTETNWSGGTYADWFFRRAPGVFDEVCDTGTGAAHTISHNLAAIPELIIRKGRSGATQWEVWHSGIANTEKLILNSTAAKATDTTAWNSTSPTASAFTVGTGANVNTSTATYVTYLFATLAGISKCGTYTGNGTTQNIEMGFSAGARFFLVKAASTTGNWVIFDSVRGIISGSDPYLLLNSTAAEDADEDAVDPYAGGIAVNETSASNINTNSVVYCYLAIA